MHSTCSYTRKPCEDTLPFRQWGCECPAWPDQMFPFQAVFLHNKQVNDNNSLMSFWAVFSQISHGELGPQIIFNSRTKLRTQRQKSMRAQACRKAIGQWLLYSVEAKRRSGLREWCTGAEMENWMTWLTKYIVTNRDVALRFHKCRLPVD